jgi:hypothetical protein
MSSVRNVLFDIEPPKLYFLGISTMLKDIVLISKINSILDEPFFFASNFSVLIDKNKTAIVSDALQADYKAKLFDNQLLANKKEAQLKLKQIKSIFFLILIGVLIFLILFFYFRFHIKKNQAKRDLLLDEIEKLKNNANKELLVVSSKFELVREKIEHSISRKLNETDWKVLTILLEDPALSNKEIADKAYMSVDGIGSSLRRMYEYFEIKESKYKKILLLLEAIKSSNNPKIEV